MVALKAALDLGIKRVRRLIPLRWIDLAEPEIQDASRARCRNARYANAAQCPKFFTIVSTIFFASASSIMVLSM